jgi:hypothetical protein
MASRCPLAEPIVPEEMHGSLSAYNYYRCRCVECREANRLRRARQYAANPVVRQRRAQRVQRRRDSEEAHRAAMAARRAERARKRYFRECVTNPVHLDGWARRGGENANSPGAGWSAWDDIPAPSGNAEEVLAQLVAERLLVLPRDHPAHRIVLRVTKGQPIGKRQAAILRAAYKTALTLVLAPRQRDGVLTTPSNGGSGLKRGRGSGHRRHVTRGRHEGRQEIIRDRAIRKAAKERAA